MSEPAIAAVGADLSITMAANIDPIVAGGRLAYTVTVDNVGPSEATDVIVTDTLPAGVTVILSRTPTGGYAACVNSDGTAVCNLGSIPPGGSSSADIRVTVDPSTVGTIVNTASVTSGVDDPSTDNNTVSLTTTVVARSADLSISWFGLASVEAGETASFLANIYNAGPADATDVIVTDAVSAGLTRVSVPGCGDGHQDTPTCNLGTIRAGSSTTWGFDGIVDSTLGDVNVAYTIDVTSDVPDPDTTNNTSTWTVIVVPLAELSIMVTSDTDTVMPGEIVTYTVTVHNAGPTDAPWVSVESSVDTGPIINGRVPLIATVGCVLDPRGVPRCSLGPIDAGGSKSFSVRVTVPSNSVGTVTYTGAIRYYPDRMPAISLSNAILASTNTSEPTVSAPTTTTAPAPRTIPATGSDRRVLLVTALVLVLAGSALRFAGRRRAVAD